MAIRRAVHWLPSLVLPIGLQACGGKRSDGHLPNFSFLKYFNDDEWRLLGLLIVVVGIVVIVIGRAYFKHREALEADRNKTKVKLAELNHRASEAKRRKQEPELFDD